MAETDRKQPPTLSSKALEEIAAAIVSGYDVSDLSRVLRFKWGFVLKNYINIQQGFRLVVTDLVEWTEQKGKTLELLAVAYSQAPGNPDLQAAAANYGLSRQDISQKYGPDGSVPKPTSLEAMVSRHSRLIDYALFTQRLQDMGERICLVETPFCKGTGFLVSPDCALTNFHVVEGVITNKVQSDEVICRFDFQARDGNRMPATSKPCRLSAAGILAYSPYSESDLSASSEVEPNKLDYALLRLAEPVASMHGDGPRGWFELTEDSSVIALHDFIVIPQHAEAQTLRIAWGSVVAFPGVGNRLRYDTTTAPGSSGAPCFTADLDLIGLHHAAEAEYSPTYNQAVPLWLVARDLAAKGIVLESK